MLFDIPSPPEILETATFGLHQHAIVLVLVNQGQVSPLGNTTISVGTDTFDTLCTYCTHSLPELMLEFFPCVGIKPPGLASQKLVLQDSAIYRPLNQHLIVHSLKGGGEQLPLLPSANLKSNGDKRPSSPHTILFLSNSRVGRFWVLRKVKLFMVSLGAKLRN